MRDELLAYLLDDLDAEDRKHVERRLERDPAYQRELEQLRTCLEASAADSPAEPTPPPDLVHRTCSFVQCAIGKTQPTAGGSSAVPASLSESHDGCTCASRWSLVDIAVGAGVLLVIAMLLFPALYGSRSAARRLACQNHLRQLGTALVAYAQSQNRGLPHIARGENAGSFVIDLFESGTLSRQQLAELLVCPSSPLADEVFAGRTAVQIPTREELHAATGQTLAQLRKSMGGSYAYRLGYLNQRGQYLPVKFVGRGDAPMLADAPSFAVAGFQSANHGGCGQNVIFQDLSCRYCSRCISPVGNDHLFLNAVGRQAAGRYMKDVVLGRSEIGPAGPLPLSPR